MTTALERFLALRKELITDGPGGDAAGLCRVLSDALDTAIIELAAPYADDVAVVAVGGYGRREQAFFSDVDLTLIHEGTLPDSLTRDVLYPLWDAGLVVGHSVRTPSQTVAAARDALVTRCALLSGRLVAGPYELYSSTWASLADLHRSRPIRAGLIDELRERRAAEPYHVLDPDLKTGRGGLRTFQALDWQRIAGGRFPTPTEEELTARRTLLGVRNGLHAVRGKKLDVLDRELQPPVARWLDRDAEEMARSVYQALRIADRLALEEWPEIAHDPSDRVSATGRRVLQAIRRRFGPPSQLTSEAQPALQIAASALRRNAGPIVTEEERRVVLTTPARPWTRHDREVLVEILGAGQRGRDVFETLAHLGWVDEALPELRHLRALPQAAPFHAHPADTHLWRAADEMLGLVRGATDDPWAATIAEELGGTDQLLLTAFFHDVGKGLGAADHSIAGAELTEAFCRRVGFGPATTGVLTKGVRDHLYLANVASRRDIDDPSVQQEVAQRMDDLRSLQVLYLLTVADLRATGPGMATPWRVGMLRRLFARVSTLLGAEIDPLSDEARIAGLVAGAPDGLDDIDLKEHVAAMPDDYLGAYTDDEIVAHASLATPVPLGGETRLDVTGGAADRVTIVGRDIPGFASVVTGVLALNNLSVVHARFNTRDDGVAIDTFDVVDALRTPGVTQERWTRVSEELSAALSGDLDLESRLRAKAQRYEPVSAGAGRARVRVSDDGRRTAIEIKTRDRIGLLHDLLRAVHELGLDLDLARIDTRANEAVDTFLVRDEAGGTLGQSRIEQVEAKLRAIASG